MPTVAELYAAGHERLLVLAADLTEADGNVAVPACPGWTVRDVFAHLAGLATDVLAGRVDGAGTDPWTAEQVAERSSRTLADNVAELAQAGPKLVEALEAFPAERIAIDQWTHEQDVRGALGRSGSRDVPLVGWALDLAIGGRNPGWGERGLPAVRINGWQLGEGEPVATFETTDFDLARALTGRRSAAQWRSWARPGSDPAAVEIVVARIPAFPARPDDLAE
jgi:uncharacterized protein (TIGR03083 family)